MLLENNEQKIEILKRGNTSYDSLNLLLRTFDVATNSKASRKLTVAWLNLYAKVIGQ